MYFAGGEKSQLYSFLYRNWTFTYLRKATPHPEGVSGSGGYSSDITCSKPIPWAILEVAFPAFPSQIMSRDDGEEPGFLDKLLLNCSLQGTSLEL